MNHSNRIPTDTVDQDEASLVPAQMVVFKQRELAEPRGISGARDPDTALRGIEFFKLLVRTTIALEGRVLAIGTSATRPRRMPRA